jgi:hypothetical protein
MNRAKLNLLALTMGLIACSEGEREEVGKTYRIAATMRNVCGGSLLRSIEFEQNP